MVSGAGSAGGRREGASGFCTEGAGGRRPSRWPVAVELAPAAAQANSSPAPGVPGPAGSQPPRAAGLHSSSSGSGSDRDPAARDRGSGRLCPLHSTRVAAGARAAHRASFFTCASSGPASSALSSSRGHGRPSPSNGSRPAPAAPALTTASGPRAPGASGPHAPPRPGAAGRSFRDAAEVRGLRRPLPIGPRPCRSGLGSYFRSLPPFPVGAAEQSEAGSRSAIFPFPSYRQLYCQDGQCA